MGRLGRTYLQAVSALHFIFSASTLPRSGSNVHILALEALTPEQRIVHTRSFLDIFLRRNFYARTFCLPSLFSSRPTG